MMKLHALRNLQSSSIPHLLIAHAAFCLGSASVSLSGAGISMEALLGMCVFKVSERTPAICIALLVWIAACDCCNICQDATVR